MFELKPDYIIDGKNRKIAVQLSIKAYEKVKDVLENYSLYQFMEDGHKVKALKLNKAKAYYSRLKKMK